MIHFTNVSGWRRFLNLWLKDGALTLGTNKVTGVEGRPEVLPY